MNSAEEIKKFKDLMDQGLITEEEFTRKKNDLLGIKSTENSEKSNDKKEKSQSSNKKMLIKFITIIIVIAVAIFGIVKIAGAIKQNAKNKAASKEIESVMSQYGLNDYKVKYASALGIEVICEDFDSLSGSDMYSCIRSIEKLSDIKVQGDTIDFSVDMYVNGSDYYYYISSLWAADSRNSYTVGGIYRSDGGSNRRCVYEE